MERGRWEGQNLQLKEVQRLEEEEVAWNYDDDDELQISIWLPSTKILISITVRDKGMS